MGIWTLIKYGLPLLVIIFVASFGWSFVSNYGKMAYKIATLENQVRKYDGRLASYRRMIDRRDLAIKASKCTKRIQYWVRNPDDIPRDMPPGNIFAPKFYKQPNAMDTEPVPAFEGPSFKMPSFTMPSLSDLKFW